MMYTTLALTTASLVGAVVQGAAIDRRQQDMSTCTTFASGYLALRPASDLSDSSSTTYVGITSGAQHADIVGSTESLLVTKDDNGNDLSPQLWDFARCTMYDNHDTPDGYEAPSDGPSNRWFGVVRPNRASKHCLALETTDVSTGSRNSIVDSDCDAIPDAYTLWMLEDDIYGNVDDGRKLYFANTEMAAVVGDTAHEEVQFVSGGDTDSCEELLQLVLLPK